MAVHNAGISGDTVVDLAARFERDVLSREPDLVSICIGINDVWRHFDTLEFGLGVSLDEYRARLSSMLDPLEQKGIGVVLMTPFFIEPNAADAMRQKMDSYAEVVRTLAHERKAVLVDAQAAFDEYLRHKSSYTLSGDRVHLNLAGHAILASSFLRACGWLEMTLPEDRA